MFLKLIGFLVLWIFLLQQIGWTDFSRYTLAPKFDRHTLEDMKEEADERLAQMSFILSESDKRAIEKLNKLLGGVRAMNTKKGFFAADEKRIKRTHYLISQLSRILKQYYDIDYKIDDTASNVDFLVQGSSTSIIPIMLTLTNGQRYVLKGCGPELYKNTPEDIKFIISTQNEMRRCRFPVPELKKTNSQNGNPLDYTIKFMGRYWMLEEFRSEGEYKEEFRWQPDKVDSVLRLAAQIQNRLNPRRLFGRRIPKRPMVDYITGHKDIVFSKAAQNGLGERQALFDQNNKFISAQHKLVKENLKIPEDDYVFIHSDLDTNVRHGPNGTISTIYDMASVRYDYKLRELNVIIMNVLTDDPATLYENLLRFMCVYQRELDPDKKLSNKELTFFIKYGLRSFFLIDAYLYAFGSREIDYASAVKVLDSFKMYANLFDTDKKIAQFIDQINKVQILAQVPKKVAEEFGLDVQNIRTISGGGAMASRPIFVLSTPGGQIPIKRLNVFNEEGAKLIIHYMLYLQSNGIPIKIMPKKGTDGSKLAHYYTKVLIKETGKYEYYHIERWGEGRQISRADASNLPETLKAVGRMLGKIHKLSRNYKSPYQSHPKSYSFSRTVGRIVDPAEQWRQKIKNYLSEKESELLDRVTEEVRNYWTSERFNSFLQHMIPSDLNFANLIFDESGIDIIQSIDWDQIRVACPLEDFFATLIQTGRREEGLYVGPLRDDLNIFLEGYKETAGDIFTDEDRLRLPAFFNTPILVHMFYNAIFLDEAPSLHAKNLSKIKMQLKTLKDIRSELGTIPEAEKALESYQLELTKSSEEPGPAAIDKSLNESQDADALLGASL